MKKFHQRHHDSTFSALTALFLICHPSRDLRPCVSGCPCLIIYHSTRVHGQPELLFVLQFFAFHSQTQISILLTRFQTVRIKSHISNSFWICCPFFSFFIYIDCFSHLKTTYALRSGYSLILQDIEKNAFRYCGLTFNDTYRFDFHFVPSSFQTFIFNAKTHIWLLDFLKSGMLNGAQINPV